jgi:small subunit ribosomal protein S6
MTLYETTYIIDPQLLDEGWEKSIAKYSDIINQNGRIKRVDRWGLRRMAYMIKKQSHAFYVHIVHESAGSVPRELERQFRLDETCFRFLTVLADNPQYLEEMDKAKAARPATLDEGLAAAAETRVAAPAEGIADVGAEMLRAASDPKPDVE